MMKKGIALGLLVLAGLAAPATADVNGREHRQRVRIREGVRSGELNRREAASLRAQQAAIRAEEAFYRRTGGRLSARERAELHRDLNRSSRSIYRQRGD